MAITEPGFEDLRSFSAEFTKSLETRYSEKRLISEYAVEHLIADGARLLIDVGTTSMVFASVLAHSRAVGIEVTTHSAAVALQFSESPGVRVIGNAGVFVAREAAFIPDRMPRQFDPFLGVEFASILSPEAFSVPRGASTSYHPIRQLTKFYISHASDIIMLLDHGKFFENRRPVITRCGLGADRWLRQAKPLTIVTEAPAGSEPDELKKLMDSSSVTASRGTGDYASVIVIKTRLHP